MKCNYCGCEKMTNDSGNYGCPKCGNYIEFKMTREQLGHVLSAQMQTRTLKAEGYEGEITEQSQVLFMEIDNDNVLNIYCKPLTELKNIYKEYREV